MSRLEIMIGMLTLIFIPPLGHSSSIDQFYIYLFLALLCLKSIQTKDFMGAITVCRCVYKLYPMFKHSSYYRVKFNIVFQNLLIFSHKEI